MGKRRLVRDVIGEALAAPVTGYFCRDVSPVSRLGERLEFAAMAGEREYKQAVASAYAAGTGHFLTPSELFAPWYSQGIARWILDHHHEPLRIVEFGGGSGANAKHLLDFVRATAPDVYARAEYLSVDVSATMVAAARDLVGHPGVFEAAVADASGDWSHLVLPRGTPAVVLALELLDNLVHDKLRWTRDESCWVPTGQIEVLGEREEVERPLEDEWIRLAADVVRRRGGPPVRNPSLWFFRRRHVVDHFVPTGALQFFANLRDHLPNHSLFLADFDELPKWSLFDPDLNKPLMSGDRGRLLGALVLIYTSNQWCRSLLFSTVNFESSDPYRFMNADVGLTASQYATLGTLAFNVLFSAASLVAGAAVDALDARVLSAAACLVWSFATVALGQMHSFGGVAACRAAQGLAMAATAPAGYALLARAFDPSRLASANAAYASAVSVGGALASASVVLDERLGWRNTFAVAGVVGAAIAALAALVFARVPVAAPPETRGADKDSATRDAVTFPPAAIAILVTTAVRFCAGFAIAVWALPCLRATFPDRATDLGLAYALVVAACGSASALLGGRLADACARLQTSLPWPFSRHANAARAIVPALGSLLAAPLWYAALATPYFSIAIAFLALEFLVAESWIGPATALLATEVPPASRGLAQGIFTSLTLVGNAAPIAIGAALSRHLVDDLTTLLAAVVVLAYLASAAGFVTIASLLKEPPTTKAD
ncbi:hypothetical protein CTAYLR_006680 [Chrysophaeum taylorii]|uniref:type II protein arginine methyltransferase n=1 Tax=Chrysophaeum taylorii TaxID=2483200 RepID=A0AAD7UG27_9STRA|nr:hypothetical protein CTAYLR_006680 [Chrysophaeum taylorii]